MPFIVPTQFKPLNGDDEHTIWMVNNDDPKTSGWTQFAETCPHCKENHVFRFFANVDYREEDGWAYEYYDCKCPTCRHVFEAVDKQQIEE